jgi:hypothetical protein
VTLGESSHSDECINSTSNASTNGTGGEGGQRRWTKTAVTGRLWVKSCGGPFFETSVMGSPSVGRWGGTSIRGDRADRQRSPRRPSSAVRTFDGRMGKDTYGAAGEASGSSAQSGRSFVGEAQATEQCNRSNKRHDATSHFRCTDARRSRRSGGKTGRRWGLGTDPDPSDGQEHCVYSESVVLWNAFDDPRALVGIDLPRQQARARLLGQSEARIFFQKDPLDFGC